jgi:hypothetical protein
MVKFIVVLLLVGAVHVVLSQIQTVNTGNSVTSGNEHQTFPAGGSLNAAGGRFIMVHSDAPHDRLILFEKNDEDGLYSIPYQTPWPRKPVFITTNGNWFGTLGGGFINTVQLASNGTFVNMTEFQSEAKLMQFLNDDTLVLFSELAIETYVFTPPSNWTKIHEQEVYFTVMSNFPLVASHDDSTPFVTDTTLAAFNPNTSSVEMYTRNQDKSWSKVDEISFAETNFKANRIVWNGNDTLVLSHTGYYDITPQGDSFGGVQIFEKINNTWILTLFKLTGDVTLSRPGYLGFSLLLLDSYTIAIGAPSNTAGGGEVFLLQRIDGADWEFTVKFIGPSDWKYFGFNIMKNDYDVIVQGGYMYGIYTYQSIIPSCYLPIKATCQNVILDSDMCQNGLDLSYPYSQFHNQDADCTTIQTGNLRVTSASSMSMTLRFSSDFSSTVYCDVTATCASPPTAPITVPTTATPIGGPTVGAPKSPSNQISGAERSMYGRVVYCGLVVVAALFY